MKKSDFWSKMALNGSHLRELEPSIHSLIKKQLGFSEPTLLKASMNCLQQGGNRDDLEGKIYFQIFKTFLNVSENILFYRSIKCSSGSTKSHKTFYEDLWNSWRIFTCQGPSPAEQYSSFTKKTPSAIWQRRKQWGLQRWAFCENGKSGDGRRSSSDNND